MIRNGNPLAALDLGNSQVTVLVAKLDGGGALRLLGIGTSESKGFRRGVPVNLEAAVDATRQAIETAERAAGVDLDSVVLGISGAHIKSFNSRGGTALGTRARDVRPDDVQRAVEAARGVRLPPDQQLLHVVPQQFVLDEETGIREPLGLIGCRLEVDVHLVTAGQVPTQNLISVANRTGLLVEDTVLSSMAAARAVLTQEEMEAGVVLIDIGGGSADWILYRDRAPRESGVVPVGGEHFTSDIAAGLRCPQWEAERIKREHGCAGLRWAGPDVLFEFSCLGDRPQRVSSRRALCDIIEPRAKELAELLRHDLARVGTGEIPAGGLVLTGGGALLNGLLEQMAHQFRAPVRLGVPRELKAPESVRMDSVLASAAGLLLHAGKIRRARERGAAPWVRRLKGILGMGGYSAEL